MESLRFEVSFINGGFAKLNYKGSRTVISATAFVVD